MYDFTTASWNVGGENKIKANLSIFFLVGPIFSSSAGSSTVEYSESALFYELTLASNNLQYFPLSRQNVK